MCKGPFVVRVVAGVVPELQLALFIEAYVYHSSVIFQG